MQITNNIHGFMWKSMSANNCNTYLIDGPTRILIDPGHTHLFDHVQQGLMKLDLTLEDIGLIICTHAHPDHIEAVQRFNKTSAMTTLHHKEWHFLKTMAPNVRASFGFGANTIEPDFFLKEGDISIDNVDLRIFHTPGHSPGSISLYLSDQKLLFTGDLVFKGGIGRTDLPGGDGSLMKDSLKRLYELDIEWLLPGHGDIIGGAEDVKTNFAHLHQMFSQI
jgi:glyoxylase-like metal-dependent hydrolase (beta-lactamase superfamily II)